MDKRIRYTNQKIGIKNDGEWTGTTYSFCGKNKELVDLLNRSINGDKEAQQILADIISEPLIMRRKEEK